MLTESLWHDFLKRHVFTKEVIAEAKQSCPREIATALEAQLASTTPIHLRGQHWKELMAHLSKGCLDSVIDRLVFADR